MVWLQEAWPNHTAEQEEALLRFGELVQESADRLGLIGRGDRDRVLTRHIQESINPVVLNILEMGARVLDVGSGGGFPSIPMAILREDLALTLTEPRRKKAAFLERAAAQLMLRNVTVYTGPMEDLARIHSGPPWDFALSRAIRWNKGMIRAARGVLAERAPIVRYGSRNLEEPGVRVIDLNEVRAVQIWPPSSWRNLPAAE